MYQKTFKQVIDFIIALIGIIILSPILLLIIISIKIDSKGPVFFKQKRVGKNKKIFKIYKFRTMKVDTPNDAPTHLLENPDFFITNVGKFLRKTSLDELPQLINILKCEMSVIGPRPALWNQYDLIKERDRYKANNIYPGLTGWAQINGRDELTVEKKAELDGIYIQKLSFLFDVKCFIITIKKVFGNDGIIEGKSVIQTSSQSEKN